MPRITWWIITFENLSYSFHLFSSVKTSICPWKSTCAGHVIVRWVVKCYIFQQNTFNQWEATIQTNMITFIRHDIRWGWWLVVYLHIYAISRVGPRKRAATNPWSRVAPRSRVVPKSRSRPPPDVNAYTCQMWLWIPRSLNDWLSLIVRIRLWLSDRQKNRLFLRIEEAIFLPRLSDWPVKLPWQVWWSASKKRAVSSNI